MPFDPQNEEISPFSQEGLNVGKKRAFKVVFALAAVSFLSMLAGLYIDFFRSPAITTTFYLEQRERGGGSSLIDPQPPEKNIKAETSGTDVRPENAEVIKQLEQGKKTIEETAVALQKMVDTVEEHPVLPESPALQKLQQEQDLAEQKKLAEIESLKQERDKLQSQKTEALPDTKKENDKEAVLAKNPAETKEKKSFELIEPKPATPPILQYEAKLPPPDLVQTSLNASLPDYSLIKKGPASNAVPLHIIEPLPELLEGTRYGKLPVKNGESAPFPAYARQVDLPPETPYIAILFTGVGKRKNATEAAINALPATVSLSFSPYADKLKDYVAEARKAGHETLLDLPMQQGAFPETDPGSLGLVSGLPEQENRKRLHKVLGQGVAVIGISAAAKESFSYSGTQMKPFFDEISQRGLIYIDGTDDPRMPKFKKAVRPDVHIADNFYRAAIRARLEQAKQIALKNGAAFIRIETLPITLQAVAEWFKSFNPTEEKPVPEVSFVPLSYYIQQKEAGK